MPRSRYVVVIPHFLLSFGAVSGLCCHTVRSARQARQSSRARQKLTRESGMAVPLSFFCLLLPVPMIYIFRALRNSPIINVLDSAARYCCLLSLIAGCAFGYLQRKTG